MLELKADLSSRLLELIVINLGLQAGILTPKLFAMFVVHAVVLTFFITPVTALIYPEKYHKHAGTLPSTRDEILPPSITSAHRTTADNGLVRPATILADQGRDDIKEEWADDQPGLMR